MKKLNERVDFVHIGMQKTASTWWQKEGFASHREIVLINRPNTDMYHFIYRRLVLADFISFDAESFIKDFNFLANFEGSLSNLKLGVCEENLCGHFWTGAGRYENLLKIKMVFPNAKVIVCVREQISMISSIYSNYLFHGGLHRFKTLMNDFVAFGYFSVQEKLCYDKYIKKIIDIFGEENVKLIFYEDFSNDPKKCVARVFEFIGVSPEEIDPRVINGSAPMLLEPLMVALNNMRLPHSLRWKLYRLFAFIGYRRMNVRDIPANMITEWAASNDRLAKCVGKKLTVLGYRGLASDGS